MKQFLIILSALGMASCANVTSPTGGPKDTIPPTLKTSIPRQEQTNYKGSQILLEFDELMKLKNPKDEIIITPEIKDVKYTAKKKLVAIDLNEKLKDSTTYSIAFRESLQDLNEGNPAEDLHLAFSTGNIIDSLSISGNVQQLLKGLPAEKYTVALYQSDTFNLFKHKPVYFTRTNKLGNFKILNLKAGDYFIYTFEDKNKNLLLESKTEKFAFKPNRISLQAQQDSVQLKTIALDSRPIVIAGIRSLGHFTKVRFNKNLTSYSITSLDSMDRKIRHCFSSSQSEVDIFPTKPSTDSTLIRLIATDSLNQTNDSTFYVKQTNSKSLKEKIKIESARCQFIETSQKLYAEFKVTELLKNIFPDSMYIMPDTITRFAFKKGEIKYDTIFRKISIEKTFEKKDSIKWKQAKLILATMAFTSIHGDSSRRTVLPITYITPEETATLIIEFPYEKSNTIVELLNENYEPIAVVRQTKTLTLKNIKPSTILLRAISDENKNGVWDPGNPNSKILPEPVTFYKNQEGKRQIPLRANWEVNIKWNY